jgi:hypothetical protein
LHSTLDCLSQLRAACSRVFLGKTDQMRTETPQRLHGSSGGSLDRICDSLHLLTYQESHAGLQTLCKSRLSAATLCCLSRSCSVSASARAALALAALCFSASVRRASLWSQGALQLHLPPARCSAPFPCAPSLVWHRHRAGPPLGITGSHGFLESPSHLLLSRGCTCTIVLRVVHLLLLPRPFLPLTLILKPHRKQLA